MAGVNATETGNEDSQPTLEFTPLFMCPLTEQPNKIEISYSLPLSHLAPFFGTYLSDNGKYHIMIAVVLVCVISKGVNFNVG